MQAELLADKIDLDALLNARHDKLTKELKPHNVIRFIEKALKAQRSLSAIERD